MSDMSLWKLVQDYCDTTGAKEAAVLRRAGLNKGAFAAWRQRGIPSLPTRRDLLGLAAALHTDYETVLTAVLHDTKYLPESVAREEQARLEVVNTEHLARVDREGKELLDELLAEFGGDFAEAREAIRGLRAEDRVNWAVADSAEIQLDELVVDEVEHRRNLSPEPATLGEPSVGSETLAPAALEVDPDLDQPAGEQPEGE